MYILSCCRARVTLRFSTGGFFSYRLVVPIIVCFLLSTTLAPDGRQRAVAASAGVAVLTQHNDNNRSGLDLNETILNTTNVTARRFGKLFTRRVDGQVYAQPLYISNLSIPGRGTHNVVFVATMNNSVYAYDADDPAAATPL